MESCETRSFACGRPVWLVLAVLSCGWALDGGAMAAEKASNPNPADGEYIETTSKLLMWTAGTYAAQHRIYLGTNHADVADGTGGTDKGFRPSSSCVALDLTPGMTYYWRVDEVNDVHPDSPWAGDVWTFTVRPLKASNPNPPDGAMNVPKNPTLTWAPGNSAALHIVYMGTSAAALALKTTTGSPTYTPSGQTDGTTYYWRVDSSPDGVNVVAGDVWRYTTWPSGPSVASNPDPADGRTVYDRTLTLMWQAGNHAVGHHLYFGSNQADVEAGTGSADKGVVSSVGYVAADLIPGTTYYWRVDEVNDAHPDSPWLGPVWTVHVAVEPASDAYPADASRLAEREVALGWTPGQTAAAHDVYLGTTLEAVRDADTTTLVIYRGRQTQTVYPPSGVLNASRGKTYYWRIDEVEADGTVAKGSIWQFTVLPTEAWGPVPQDGKRILNTQTMLAWERGAYADKHHVYFGASRMDVANGAGGTDRGLTANTSYFAGALVPGATYYWRVDEINDAHPDSPWTGAVWSFRVASAKAEGPNPPDGALGVTKNSPISWMPGLNAIASYVYMGTSPGAMQQKTLTQKPTYTPTGQADSATYYWRVDSIDTQMNVTVGDIWCYTTWTWWCPRWCLWWSCDTVAGGIVFDESGMGRHGTMVGGVSQVSGRQGSGLGFDGQTGCVTAGDSRIAQGTFSVGMWVRYERLSGDAALMCNDAWDAGALRMYLGATGRVRAEVCGGGSVEGQTPLRAGHWEHVALVLDHMGGQTLLYINGVLEDITGDGGSVTPYIGPMTVGARGGTSDFYTGALDEIRIDGWAWTQQEVWLHVRGSLEAAYSPNPYDGAVVEEGVVEHLTWLPGDSAVAHDVYLGVSKSLVQQATVSNGRGVYMGRPTDLAFPEDAALSLGSGAYYWRVDEVDAAGGITQGPVWQFRVGGFLVVDDFESYGDTAAPGGPVECVWKDGAGYAEPLPGYPGNGSGSTVGIGRQGVHGDGQMLVVDYDNAAGPYCSFVEARTAALAVGPDWSREQVRAMSVWFKGEPDNSAEWMYVELVDGAGRLRRVFYPDVFATRYESWTQWHIALGAFQGVNLADVESVSLGIGTPGGGNPAGAGRMCFDDIRLYRRRCVPEFSPGDATGDCRSDWADVAAVAGQWLAEGLGVAADMDGDGVVDFRDMAAMLENWLIGEVLWP